jgi:hypothetical protein
MIAVHGRDTPRRPLGSIRDKQQFTAPEPSF